MTKVRCKLPDKSYRSRQLHLTRNSQSYLACC